MVACYDRVETVKELHQRSNKDKVLSKYNRNKNPLLLFSRDVVGIKLCWSTIRANSPIKVK